MDDRDLLALAASGLSLRRIAAQVGISHEAVRLRLARLTLALHSATRDAGRSRSSSRPARVAGL